MIGSGEKLRNLPEFNSVNNSRTNSIDDPSSMIQNFDDPRENMRPNAPLVRVVWIVYVLKFNKCLTELLLGFVLVSIFSSEFLNKFNYHTSMIVSYIYY